MLIPYAVLFCGGVVLTLCQSFGILTPLPYTGGLWDAYTALFSTGWFSKSFLFSVQVGGCSAIISVAAGTLLGYGVWRLPERLKGFSLVYKIPLILPHIAVAFLVMLFWSRSGLISSAAWSLGLIRDMDQFPNLLYSGYGLGMILAYALKGTPFVMLLALAQLSGFDIRQVRTAAMLGASGATIFFKIILPRLAPAMHTGFIILFLYSFGAFDIPYLLSESRPGMVSIHVYNLYFKHDLERRPEAMAALVVMFMFAAGFIALYSRIVSRMERGGRKL